MNLRSRVINYPHLEQRCELAAVKATAAMRALGLAFPDQPRPPLLNEVKWYLQGVLDSALESYFEAFDDGKTDDYSREVEGFASDDRLFELTVHQTGKKGELDVTILMILV